MLNITMHTTNQILSAIAERNGGATDYRLSKLFGTSPQTVAHWRHGRSALSLDYALKAAALLEWEPAYVVACVERERAEKDARLEATDEIKATWEKIAQAFKPAAAVILAVMLGLTTLAPSKAYAAERAPVPTGHLYIMRSRTRRAVAALLRRLSRFLNIAGCAYGFAAHSAL